MKVYIDNAATTKTSKVAIDTMVSYMTEYYGNPSSLYTIGQVFRRIRYIVLFLQRRQLKPL